MVLSGTAVKVGKLVAYAALFVVFHFAYDWAPSRFTAIFSGIDESVFQHAKIGWFAWIAASALEALVLRPRRGLRLDFVASRLWGGGFATGLQSVFWFLAPAVAGPLPNDAVEVAWAFVSLAAGGVTAIALEERLARAPLGRFLRIAAFVFAVIGVFLFIRFTIEPPWVDVFAPPRPPLPIGGAP
jgi:hypothetical protein